jgi:tRNA (guanine-N7-)-methyltransferase
MLEKRKIRHIRSFTHRERSLPMVKQVAFEKLWAQYGLELQTGLIDVAAHWGRAAPLILEIGFGTGEALLKLAQDHPQNNYLGVEVYGPGQEKLLQGVETHKLQNVRIYRDDVVEVLAKCVPDLSLDAVLIFFPDPWPKRRHHKRRLVQSEFLDLLVKKLKSGAYLHFASDDEDYAIWVLKIMRKRSDFVAVKNDTAANLFVARPNSKFARRTQQVDGKIWDLVFVKENIF